MSVQEMATSRQAATASRPGAQRRRRKAGLAGYAFLSPLLLLVGLFVVVPLLWALLISLQRTDGFGDGVFVGLENYRRLVVDPVFWRSALNTVLFTVVVVPVSMALGLLLAVLLDSVLPARGVFRAAVVLPMSISGVATALIGVLAFDQNVGIVNKLLEGVGLGGVPWQSSGGAAFTSVVLVTLWWRVGFNMIVYLAALQGVPAELHEAARLDGAGVRQRFWWITRPLVGPASFFLVVMNVIYSFQVFDIVFVMTQGGPGYSTSVLVTYAYNNGFVTRDQGYAAAIGFVLLLSTLVFTAVQWRTRRRQEDLA